MSRMSPILERMQHDLDGTQKEQAFVIDGGPIPKLVVVEWHEVAAGPV